MLALNKGKPEQMNLKDMLSAFIDFREEVITKRTIYDLKKQEIKLIFNWFSSSECNI